MKVQATTNIRHNGKHYKSGDPITDISDIEAKRLVKLQDAFFIGKETVISDIGVADGTEYLLNNGGNPQNSSDEDNEAFKAIDEAYESYIELKNAALEVDGLEFPGNISKKNLINLIIEKDMVNEFLEDDAE